MLVLCPISFSDMMSIKIKLKGDKTIIETDRREDARLHYFLRENSPVLFAEMKRYKINEIEVKAGYNETERLHEKLEEEIEKAGFGKIRIHEPSWRW